MFLLALATAIFYAFVVRTMYIALEPHVRRRWPQTIISWSAVLTGHWRDPIVGRDVLVGAALAVGLRPILVSLNFASSDFPNLGPTDVLLGFRSTLAVCFTSIPHGIRETLMFFFIIFLLRILLRNQWLASAGFALIFATLSYLQSSHPIANAVVGLLVYGLVSFIVLRFGLLALAVYIFVHGLLVGVQPTMQTSSWYFPNSLFLLACVVALAAWGFRISIAGRKLWKQDLLA
jgi:serine/threonine-protein kinase